MRGRIHHLDLTVKDPWASASFYGAVLGFMGYRRTNDDADGFDWQLPQSGEGFASIGLVAARGPDAVRAHNRYAPGLHHVAFHADSRADVDALHDRLTTIGAIVLNPPAAYPEYGEGYYALFFADPDGLKLEFVFLP